ncbi:hypothetical protein [Aridibaculum aurantiacum]|uniref:hypothetical protein n=1 Tax=Aridibaculum aurantiacum TaxID=2810307 RepID=UPI001A96D9B3|nr:hypothetical protein [Aridibaculum aurantiacum]
MNWNFEVSPGHIPEYRLHSSEGTQLMFKYNSQQQSIRMKFNNYQGVYLLGDAGISARKFPLLNVYGSEIGTVSKSVINPLQGTIYLEDHYKITYKINPQQSSVELRYKEQVNVCQLGGEWNKAYEALGLITAIALSWMYAVAVSRQQLSAA